MWICPVCGCENSDDEDVCICCGAYRDEVCYDAEDDLEDS